MGSAQISLPDSLPDRHLGDGLCYYGRQMQQGQIPYCDSYRMRGPYEHSLNWFSKARRRLGSTVSDPVRLRQREAERTYRFGVAPAIAAEDSIDFEIEEYRVLHRLWSNNGVRGYWTLINELSQSDCEHPLVGRALPGRGPEALQRGQDAPHWPDG